MQFRWWLLNSFSTPYSENWLERRYILGLAIVKGSISKWVFWVINISTFFSYCLPVHWCWPLVLVWWNFIFKLSVNWPLIISGARLEKRVLPLLCFMDEDLFTFRFTNRPTDRVRVDADKEKICLSGRKDKTHFGETFSQLARQISICETDFSLQDRFHNHPIELTIECTHNFEWSENADENVAEWGQ